MARLWPLSSFVERIICKFGCNVFERFITYCPTWLIIVITRGMITLYTGSRHSWNKHFLHYIFAWKTVTRCHDLENFTWSSYPLFTKIACNYVFGIWYDINDLSYQRHTSCGSFYVCTCLWMKSVMYYQLWKKSCTAKKLWAPFRCSYHCLQLLPDVFHVRNRQKLQLYAPRTWHVGHVTGSRFMMGTRYVRHIASQDVRTSICRYSRCAPLVHCYFFVLFIGMDNIVVEVGRLVSRLLPPCVYTVSTSAAHFQSDWNFLLMLIIIGNIHRNRVPSIGLSSRSGAMPDEAVELKFLPNPLMKLFSNFLIFKHDNMTNQSKQLFSGTKVHWYARSVHQYHYNGKPPFPWISRSLPFRVHATWQN